jgi:protein-S-isoprenylcysteine O-methyltransferase Ste14
MTHKDEITYQRAVRRERIQIWVMTKVCSLLCLFFIAAATRFPHYLATADHIRLLGVILFGLIILLGVIAIIQAHISLWRQAKNIGNKTNENFNLSSFYPQS